MREIRFRARHNGNFAYFTLDELRHHNTKVPTWVYEAGESVMFNLWTGRYDVEGVGIYEGDIYECGGLGNFEVCLGHFDNKIGYDEQQDGIGFYLKNKDIIYSITYIDLHKNHKVIGNIYQNPELITNLKKEV